MRLVDHIDTAKERSAYASLVRDYLSQAWEEVAGALPGASLGLVGSFARDAGGPRSDLDVVILVPKALGKFPKGDEAVTRFIQGLWDTGLGVDHSVRTPDEASRMAATDLPALSGLLHLQHIAGDQTLTDHTAKRILDEYRKASRRRAEELLRDAEARWESFDKLDRLNEPDLKNSEGGLRDIDLLQALSIAWLTDYDRPAVDRAERVILDARDSLHRVSGRHSTRLLRIYQPEVATELGYADETDLMRDLRDQATVISLQARLAADAARAARKSWGPMGLSRRKTPSRFNPDWVSETLQVTDGRLFFRDQSRGRKAEDFFDIAIWSATHDMRISSSAIKELAAMTQEPFEWNHSRLDALIRLLGSGPGLRNTWAQLDRADIPTWLIPQWEGLRGRPQSADFHQWTVDRHLIETVIRAQAIIAGEEPEWTGAPIPAPSVLLLTALLHDIGKQPPDGGVNHAAHGGKLARPILERMGCEQSSLVLSLIENHLLLATLSTDEDPEDPTTVERLLEAVEWDEDRLTLLEALTYADSLGAGPKAWSPWRAALIRQLVSLAHERINSGGNPQSEH